MPSIKPVRLASPRLDYLSKYGAGILAATIQTFWKSRGHGHVTAERYEISEMPDVWSVRSNLIAGKPPVVIG
jgi:hypothetical protein